MARYPTKTNFAKKSAAKNNIRVRRKKYYADRVKNDEQLLKEALADKSKIILVEVIGNFVRIIFKNKRPVLLCRPLKAVKAKLRSKIFWQCNRGLIVNLSYCIGFDKSHGQVHIILPEKLQAKMSRDAIKKLPELKLYLLGNEFVKSQKRQFVI
jgi:DNA-binding LytR/AlgR family response regulator